ncbi:MAG: SHOCT-like domain-containing protein [Anaerolineae bacterium]
MAKQTLSAGATPRLRIERVRGDLSLVGWEGADILLKADEEELRLNQEGDLVTLSCEGDLALRVPRGASLTVLVVEGDAAIRGLEGAIEIGEIHGDLSARDVQVLSVASVHADFSLRGAQGEIHLRNVAGDASLRDVRGNIALDSVADDLALRHVQGNVRANVGEDAVIYLEPRPGDSCAITTGEDILLVLPANADAALVMNADEISVDWPGIPFEDTAARVVTLGKGSANIVLKAGGEIRVTSNEQAGESADEFGNFAGMMFDWSDFGQDLGEQISRRVREATRRAEKQATAAARRAEQALRRPSRWGWRGGPAAPRPPVEPPSDEERLAILRMLAEKKITAEEAEKLLAALEGEE